jgi:hypothetical protein
VGGTEPSCRAWARCLGEVVAVGRVPDDPALGQAVPVGLGGVEGPAGGVQPLGRAAVGAVGGERPHLPTRHHGADHGRAALGHQVLDVPAQPLEGDLHPVVGRLDRDWALEEYERWLAASLVAALFPAGRP